jgi:putative transposase
MAHKLIRHYGRGHLHFITFTCYRRLPLLRSVRARNVFVDILGQVRDRYGFSLVGYIVMPEHIHLLISEPTKGTPSTAIQVLKQRVSRRLRRKRRTPRGQLNLIFASGDDSLPRFWQRRFYDFNVWSLKKKGREAPLHAHEPIEKKIGRSSQGLALEQLFLLLEPQTRVDPG